ncbi:MAG: YkvA family protein [Burkholderiaceae bacterium]
MWKRLSVLWLVVKGDARRLWFALRHPDAPRWLKVGTALVLLYLVSPLDLIPDTLPIIGVVDDLVLVPAAIRWMLSRLPLHIRSAADAHLTSA